MKKIQIERENNESSTIEMKLQPVDAYKKLECEPEAYDGGFHIQVSGASKNRIIGKRSDLQEFSCR